MLSRILAIVTVLLVSMGCFGYNSSTYTRTLVGNPTEYNGNLVYTFVENQNTERNGIVVNSRPTMYTSFECPMDAQPSLELMNATGVDEVGNSCRVLRRFNFGTEATISSSQDDFVDRYHDHMDAMSERFLENDEPGHNRDNEGSDDLEEVDVPLGQSGQIGY